ncbi:MAG: hypothetical protein KA419_16395, partial [Acidobacteria bacterium]|nr:hypothetical protein [Acidobacteriota bacterium]
NALLVFWKAVRENPGPNRFPFSPGPKFAPAHPQRRLIFCEGIKADRLKVDRLKAVRLKV